MIGIFRSWVALVAWSLLVIAGVALVRAPVRAPILIFGSLASTIWPLGRAWRDARGTALRSAVAWGCLAVGLGMMAQAVGWRESVLAGRPGAGHWTYLSSLATLAALLSVLNARRPGSGAWALLMALLVLVFLIPWLEASGLDRRAGGLTRLRLESPWTLFYGLLVLAGVTNYLPTRYGPASAWLALGLGLEYLGLTRPAWPPTRLALIWSAVPWTFAAAIWTAEARSRGAAVGRSRMERLWSWFRDSWGVVWALRVQERFNRSAEAAGWPIRLSWHGIIPASGEGGGVSPPVPDAAEATLKGLLRRFADEERLEAEAGRDPGGPCHPRDARGSW